MSMIFTTRDFFCKQKAKSHICCLENRAKEVWIAISQTVVVVLVLIHRGPYSIYKQEINPPLQI